MTGGGRLTPSAVVREDDRIGAVLGRERNVLDVLDALDDDGQRRDALEPRDVVPVGRARGRVARCQRAAWRRPAERSRRTHHVMSGSAARFLTRRMSVEGTAPTPYCAQGKGGWRGQRAALEDDGSTTRARSGLTPLVASLARLSSSRLPRTARSGAVARADFQRGVQDRCGRGNGEGRVGLADGEDDSRGAHALDLLDELLGDLYRTTQKQGQPERAIVKGGGQ